MRHEDLINIGFEHNANLMSDSYSLLIPGLHISVFVDRMTSFDVITIEAAEDNTEKIRDNLIEIFKKLKDNAES